MGNNVTTHSHMVPESYLKNFANDENQVWVYSMERDKCYQQNIDKTCVKNKTYEFQKNKVDNTLEHLFAAFEGRWSPLLSDIINGKATLTKEDIFNLLYFCMVQSNRTQQGRNKLMKAAKTNKEFINILDCFSDNVNIENRVLEKSLLPLANEAENCIVTEIKICETQREIYTTDHPIVRGSFFSYIYCPLTSHSYMWITTVFRENLLYYQNPVTIERVCDKNLTQILVHEDFEYAIKKTKFTEEEIRSFQQIKLNKMQKLL